MKRALARLGLLGLLVGTPLVLGSLVGSPMIPNFQGSDGLSGSFVPVETVLRVLGLLSWALWAYLAFAVLLHAAAIVATFRGTPGQRVLLVASSILTPKIVRSLVEFAIGSALVASSVSIHVSSALPAVSAPVLVEAGPARSTGELLHHIASGEPVREAHRVRPGDSLWRIAERELGSGFRWREIYRLNEGKRFPDGKSLTDPHLIYPGWVLDLPSEGQAPPAQQDEGEHERPLHQGHVTQVSPSATPSPRPTRTYESPTQEIQGQPDHDPEVDEPGTSGPMDPALEIPSGLLVAVSFASGLLTAHLLGRLHRRRSRRLSGVASVEPSVMPELIGDLRRAGASEMAGPIDVALDAVIDAWRAHTGSWPHVIAAVEATRRVSVILHESDAALPGSSGGTLSPRVRFARAGTHVIAEVVGPFPARLRQPRSPLERGLLVPLGRAPDGSAVHASVTGLGQVSLTGPNAASLARQILVAVSTQGSPDDLRLVLLGDSAEMKGLCRLPQVAKCCGWEEASDALREVELELIRRARLFMQEGAKDIDDHLADHSDEQLPALLLVCEEPPAVLGGVIEALGRQASTLGAAVFAMGWAPEGTALLARVGSSIELGTDLPCPKVLEPFVLDASAEQEAIEVIREAYPPEPRAERAAEEPWEAAGEFQAPAPIQVEAAPAPPRLVVEEERSLSSPDDSPEPPPQMMAIRCLGPYEISREGNPLRTGWKAKGRELLAYLVANPSGAPKERIIEELWPGIDPKTGGARFDRYATLVRSHARGTEDSRMFIERAGDSSYRLEGGAWWVDAWEFERLIREAERSEDAVEAVNRFREATALYRGEFCDDAYYPWLEGTRERLRSLFVEACARLAYLLSAAQEHDEALAVLDRAIKNDPVCEDLVRRAMAVEAALGRRAAALSRYHKLEATLDEQLSVEPDPETQALVQRLLRPRERAG
jgi:DNA-binding SARP family transcriptional activator